MCGNIENEQPYMSETGRNDVKTGLLMILGGLVLTAGGSLLERLRKPKTASKSEL